MTMPLQRHTQFARSLTRRWFLRDCGVGLAGIALNALLAGDSPAAPSRRPLAPRQPHFPAKAKRVVFHGKYGAPSPQEIGRAHL